MHFRTFLFCFVCGGGGGVLFADYVNSSVFSPEQQHVVTRFCQVIASKLGITASVESTKAKAATRIICSCVRDYIHRPPSLISLMVSVDVKHHVYLLTYYIHI